MKDKTKKVTVANFNTVFLDENNGDNEMPLLECFDTIVMPALRSGITRKVGDDEYIIMNISVSETKNGDYVLTGYIVKKTILERFSDLDREGNLIELDDKYSAAPYSLFVIYLKNHRMIFVENQKGSPRLSSFRSTIKYIIDTYVKRKNANGGEDADKLPTPLVSVIGIPAQNNIEKELNGIKKIDELQLRFFPLNGDGDISFENEISALSNGLRKNLGANNGKIIINSPKKIDSVIELITRVKGTIEPVIKVTDANGAKKTIKNDKISENIKLKIDGANLQEELDQSISAGLDIDSINVISNDNEEIYNKFITKIIEFAKK